MSKTETGFRPPHCLAPVVGGGGYLWIGLFGVNRPFQAFRGAPGRPGIWPQKPPRAAEGLPSHVRSDSIEARENTHPGEKIKRLFSRPFFVSVCAPTRAGGGYLVAVSLPVNRSLSGPRPPAPRYSGYRRTGVASEPPRVTPRLLATMSADAWLDRRSGPDFKDLVVPVLRS